MYHIGPMSSGFAREIVRWVYPAEYSIYSFENSEDTLEELMNGEYFACMDSEKELVGYFCFGKSAQIPTVENNRYGIDGLEMGLGLKPECCGRGLGAAFMKAGMEYARIQFGSTYFRLTVACFNQRAVKLYTNLGFKISDEVTHQISHTRFYLMTLAAPYPPNQSDRFTQSSVSAATA